MKRVIQYMAGNRAQKVTSRRTRLLCLRETDATKQHAAWLELHMHPNVKGAWQATEEEEHESGTGAVLDGVWRNLRTSAQLRRDVRFHGVGAASLAIAGLRPGAPHQCWRQQPVPDFHMCAPLS